MFPEIGGILDRIPFEGQMIHPVIVVIVNSEIATGMLAFVVLVTLQAGAQLTESWRGPSCLDLLCSTFITCRWPVCPV